MKYQDPLGLSEENQVYTTLVNDVSPDKVKIKTNSGKAIQGISAAIMLIGVLFSLLLAGMVGIVVLDITDEGVVGFLLGAVVFTIGCLLSWIETRVLRGFGEIVEYTAETAVYLEFLCKIPHTKE